MIHLFLLITSLLACAADVESAATAVDVKGAVQFRTKKGALESLFRGRRVPAGSTVITPAGAFAKLSFIDGSEITVQPGSQFRVDLPPSEEQPGVFSLLLGGVRAKFSKAINEKPKALIRTNHSVMGVRGTEFQAVYNPQNRVASVVTFEGQVAVVSADVGSIPDSARLLGSYEAAVSDRDRVAFVGTGQYSGVTPGVAPSIPVRISPAQFETLRLVNAAVPAAVSAHASEAAASSPVPPGVDARLLATAAPAALQADSPGDGAPHVNDVVTGGGGFVVTAPPEGFVDGATGRVAPPAGGFVDLKSGIYVPPPPGSSFDPVTQVFVPPPTRGSFNATTGDFAPPPGIQLDPVHGLVAAGGAPGVLPPMTPAAAAPGADANSLAKPTVAPAVVAPGTAAPLALLFAGVDPALFAGGMMAAPPPPGSELRTYLAPPLAAAGVAVTLPPSASVVLSAAQPPSGAAPTPGGYYAMPPAPNGQYYAGFDGFQPQYPVYNPFLCPPYCDPAYQPGFYPGMPAPAGDTRVSFIINE